MCRRVAVGLALASASLLGSIDVWAQHNATNMESVSITGLNSPDDIPDPKPTGTDREIRTGIENCLGYFEGDGDPTFTVTWTVDDSVLADEARFVIKLKHGAETCSAEEFSPTENPDVCALLEGPSTFTGTASRPFTMTEILSGNIAEADDCLDSENSSNHEIFFLFEERSTDTSDTEEKVVVDDRLLFTLDLGRPTTPTGVTVDGGETTLVVDWEEVSTASSYVVWVSEVAGVLEAVQTPETDTDNSRRHSVAATQTHDNVSVSGIGTYHVAVASIDGVGNSSLLSEVFSVTTTPTQDFWEGYQSAGGDEKGGCAVASPSKAGGAFALFGLVGALLPLVRRRRS